LEFDLIDGWFPFGCGVLFLFDTVPYSDTHTFVFSFLLFGFGVPRLGYLIRWKGLICPRVTTGWYGLVGCYRAGKRNGKGREGKKGVLVPGEKIPQKQGRKG
jgi:hypothetical protein